MSDSSGWCTIESDPGVFTELIEQLGVKGLEFQEVFSLDDPLRKVYGLVFLFKYGKESLRDPLPVVPEGMFFARQVVENACATQAILSILLNLDGVAKNHVHLGETLSQFKEFTQGMDEEMKGLAISNSDVIRVAHNSFRPNISLEISHDDDKRAGEAFHFVSLIWQSGSVFELDGLQKGPTHVGPCPNQEDWLTVALPYLKSRISELTTSSEDGKEIRFNLMAIVEDERAGLIEQLNSDLGESPSVLSELQGKLALIEERRDRWRLENARRRHDFIPLALACMQVLAARGQLVDLFNEAARGAHE